MVAGTRRLLWVMDILSRWLRVLELPHCLSCITTRLRLHVSCGVVVVRHGWNTSKLTILRRIVWLTVWETGPHGRWHGLGLGRLGQASIQATLVQHYHMIVRVSQVRGAWAPTRAHESVETSRRIAGFFALNTKTRITINGRTRLNSCSSPLKYHIFDEGKCIYTCVYHQVSKNIRARVATIALRFADGFRTISMCWIAP